MYDLHLLGWSSFQNLCLTITREILGQTVQSFLDTNDAGRDGAFSGIWTTSKNENINGNFVIQCKFSNKPSFNLSKSGITNELPKVRKLAAKGCCDVYILMTNAGISAKQDSLIKTELLNAGVKYVLIFGSTWIVNQIKENTRLRMLVPRIYGLGDLSQIIDERAYSQARAVLESLREDLAKVVVTNSYRKAVEALDEHGFVMLIGEPAAGKTTIASMLAMAAADKWDSCVLKLAEPSKVVEHWNVDEPNQFFWVDDAFGVTQYESSLAHGWNHILVHAKSMLRNGAKIVMTSRDYIYNRARQDLKQSSFPLFKENQIVIDVHDLTDFEKQQILYNHLKLGKQPSNFRSSIKPYLEYVSSRPLFIPETARRLADPLFTAALPIKKYDLAEFVDKREQLLLEVIDSLTIEDRAALGLIYMRKDHLESPIIPKDSETQALARLGSTLAGCIRSLTSLNGSLVTQIQSDDFSVWRFKHPTIGDAYANSLAANIDLLGIFLSGSSIENLLPQITCGNVGVENAVVVPKSLYLTVADLLIGFSESEKYKEQFLSAWQAKRSLCRFLANRCTKEFLEIYLGKNSEILDHISKPNSSLKYSPEVELVERLHKLDLYPESYRRTFIESVTRYAVDGENLHVLDNSTLANVFIEKELNNLIEMVRCDLLPRLPDIRLSLEDNYDSTREPDEHMRELTESLGILKNQFREDEAALKTIEYEEELVNEWTIKAEPPIPEISPRTFGTMDSSVEKYGTRSIFDDIDEN